jgi:hypothetical protein
MNEDEQRQTAGLRFDGGLPGPFRMSLGGASGSIRIPEENSDSQRHGENPCAEERQADSLVTPKIHSSPECIQSCGVHIGGLNNSNSSNARVLGPFRRLVWTDFGRDEISRQVASHY